MAASLDILGIKLLKNFYWSYVKLSLFSLFIEMSMDRLSTLCQNQRMLTKKYFLFILLYTFNCNLAFAEIRPIDNFNISQYLGKWYEIARLDHWFERDMIQVSANYSMLNDGVIKVTNQGLKKPSKPKVANGKARFVGKRDQGHLKVSFFWPFSTPYIIFELDDNYQFAYVTSDSKSYLWFLARTPCVSQKLKDDFEEKTNSLGFDLSGLIYVEQICNPLDENIKIKKSGL
ncbi:MAG: lipocalin family protein [Cellvibrionales bacterium]|jgi:apolipoprotein D and lipocalin family protein|nr:lipocalin family protein [Cellvibrionales bacterium]MDC0411972.1 lipocalin family protein [Porticoccus sp.]MDC1093443.1 lipocalin family protein [Porticoccus sp.]MDC1270297.1 lipocalin family protein [Porticoccus sp.]